MEDFETVMDAVGSERAALMGTIDGGMLALAFAEARPERTRAVIAFEVPHGSGAGTSQVFVSSTVKDLIVGSGISRSRTEGFTPSRGSLASGTCTR